MTINMKQTGSVAFAVFLALTTPALAQEPGGPGGGGFTVGLLGFRGDTAYGFTETAALPFIEYENEYFKLGLPTLDVKLPWISTETLSFGLSVDLLGGEGGYEASDAPHLRGMAEREAGIWAGAVMDWRTEAVDLSFRAMTDIGGDSEGSSLSVMASRDFFVGERLMITPKLGATWLDDKAVNYYYGVTQAEAAPGRAAYTGTSTVNVEAGITFGYLLSERQMLMLDVSVTNPGSGITDSPVVTEDRLTSVGLGYMLKF
ncbi:MipA/OmpV family protein [Pseudogemmobacter bohemicus]|uniref:MipA/OmpV family protein n=1 Tax=Pseudogemmobacter bohemicus TaxID=2250708 RepID=UPI000DD354A5|nr:MipA/OmpV family protein [Pseudogemmobacter bohemicus]